MLPGLFEILLNVAIIKAKIQVLEKVQHSSIVLKNTYDIKAHSRLFPTRSKRDKR